MRHFVFRRQARRAGAAALTLAAATALGLAYAPVASAAAPKYTVQTLHFLVQVGPTGTTKCDIIGDLFLPRAASATATVPAVLATNGFGGSKNDQSNWGASLAGDQGYAVLSYSGLGFGGSGCKITLDDPDFDGKAASQLVDFLGGKSGIAFTDAKHTVPVAPLDMIKLDATAHDGVHHAYDPRVGTIGGSYGGGFQFAVASIDPRVDTLVPMITWNDLSYSLGPNNVASAWPALGARTPGVTKLAWGLGFSLLGVTTGLQNIQADQGRLVGCPNFADWICPALVNAGTTGYLDNASITRLKHASVASYISKVKVPTLLMQGEVDDLFNLNEAVATYQALKAQGTPVSMIWNSWGHSGSNPRGGEFANDGEPLSPTMQYDTARIYTWFAHYLKDSSVGTGPAFAYYRPWVEFTGSAKPAYGTAGSFPVGKSRTWHLSGTSDLTDPRTVEGLNSAPGSQTILAGPAGLPTSGGPLDGLGSVLPGLSDPLPTLPGAEALWKTAPVTSAVNVAGVPGAVLEFESKLGSLTQALGPAGQVVVFLRIVDVAPDGTVSPIDLQIAPVRLPIVAAQTGDPSAAVNPQTVIKFPAIVHQFAPGHSIGLQLLGGSPNYRGMLTAADVTLRSFNQQTLSLPIIN